MASLAAAFFFILNIGVNMEELANNIKPF